VVSSRSCRRRCLHRFCGLLCASLTMSQIAEPGGTRVARRAGRLFERRLCAAHPARQAQPELCLGRGVTPWLGAAGGQGGQHPGAAVDAAHGAVGGLRLEAAGADRPGGARPRQARLHARQPGRAPGQGAPPIIARTLYHIFYTLYCATCSRRRRSLAGCATSAHVLACNPSLAPRGAAA